MYPYIYITLPSYGVMAFVGCFAVLIVTYLRLEKYQVPFATFLKLFLLSGIGGYLGSKLLYAVTQIPHLLADFSLKNLFLLVLESGFVFYGGLFGVLFTIHVCTRRDHDMRKRIWSMIAPAVPLFHGFGRIGCMMAGCCYGKALSEPVLLFGIFVFERIPVQMIEAMYEFLLCVVIFAAEKHKGFRGLRFYLIAYSLFRFVIEFFRGDAVRGIFFGVSTAQWISLFILGYYLVIFLIAAIDTISVKK
ncbi:MAG: prolipoprotein diacylglyceryl transferase [Bacteroidales bacterium]|nr:prolipoprotein diacylglyceryl transferase [Bacteroidales bacterium]MCM1414603.1 prolipoprotein diacylglyceryl transferase [bacterium]MCM1423965.1 prolipoprotein diacylglyceryl transferase [bacterium]